MRNYHILSFTRVIAGVVHVYNAQRTGNEYTGMYNCTTLIGAEANKITTDFICMPNSAIRSIKDNNRNLEFSIREVTTQGTINSIRLNNRRAEVLLNAARTVYTDIGTLTKLPVTPVVRTTAAATTPVTTTPSRSQIVSDFTTLEAKIVATRDIRLEKTLKASIPTTLQEFLVKFFKTYNEEKNTIYVDDKTVQTTMGRRRSLGDIFKICKYYFPTCTLQEVLVLLYKTLPSLITDGFRQSYCSIIRKKVWYYEEGAANAVLNTGINDEYGNRVEWYTSKL